MPVDDVADSHACNLVQWQPALPLTGHLIPPGQHGRTNSISKYFRPNILYHVLQGLRDIFLSFSVPTFCSLHVKICCGFLWSDDHIRIVQFYRPSPGGRGVRLESQSDLKMINKYFSRKQVIGGFALTFEIINNLKFKYFKHDQIDIQILWRRQHWPPRILCEHLV